MIRPTIFLLFGLFLCSCVGKKKYLEQKSGLEEQLANTRFVKDQAIDSLQTALYRAQGGNELLLIAQQQFQERLIELDNERRQLSGNLSATESKLRQQIGDLTAEKAELLRKSTALADEYKNTVSDFTGELVNIAESLQKDSLLAPLLDIRVKSGSLVLSVQEDNLFAKRVHDRLLPDENGLLQAVVNVLHAYPLLDIQVVGHTDNSTPARNQPDNLTFAGLRAATISKELANQYYLSASRITASSQGDSTPLKSNETEEGRKMNRRIEFRINNSLTTFLRKLDAIGQEKE